MRASEPSRTAMGAALHRAAHQVLDVPPVFRDPLALRIIGPEAEHWLRSGEDEHAKPAASGLRALIAVRSRIAEDALRDAIARGVAQYVVVGAGLDTFAYRAADEVAASASRGKPASAAGALRIVEVDHPATQGWKRELLARAAIAIPANVTLAPVDFERETLRDGLARAGFDLAKPAVLAWLGVVPYLTHEIVSATLRLVATELARGSEIIFDYAAPSTGMSEAERARMAEFAARLAESGEPLRSELDPGALVHELAALGFIAIEDLDASALNARYFAGRSDGLAVRGRGRVARART